jgi:phosphotransferase system HPr-like phosphotransfer protein
MMVMVPQGGELLVEVHGVDAADALEALAALIAAPSDDDLAPTPPPASG